MLRAFPDVTYINQACMSLLVEQGVWKAYGKFGGISWHLIPSSLHFFPKQNKKKNRVLRKIKMTSRRGMQDRAKTQPEVWRGRWPQISAFAQKMEAWSDKSAEWNKLIHAHSHTRHVSSGQSVRWGGGGWCPHGHLCQFNVCVWSVWLISPPSQNFFCSFVLSPGFHLSHIPLLACCVCIKHVDICNRGKCLCTGSFFFCIFLF